MVQEALMGTYKELLGAKVPARKAAALTGVSRATAGRKHASPGISRERAEPVNKLGAAERAQLLAVLDSPEYVDQAPLQVYAGLLDEGTYLASPSTMYQVLAEQKQVKERRRLARHPARVRPELVATGPGQVYTCYADFVVMPMSGPVARFQAGTGMKRSA